MLAALADREFDILVIGGGITGCGIARDAALRGLRVALVEKDDFACGTSSRSSRLIHGGLRYLEHGHFHLVFEASIERRRLLDLAPGLVRPMAFVWPVYRGARVGPWKLEAGLTLYDALALFRNVGRHRRLSRRAVLDVAPGLAADGLRGGARYYDAATDDARLTIANAVAAAGLGAIVVNHARAVALAAAGGRAVGAVVEDAFSRERIDVRARVVVNACGPWSDEVMQMETAQRRTAVRGSKGAHIAVPRERIGNREALTLLSRLDGRVMFVLPAGDQAIIGTTESYTDAHPDDVRASEADVAYLIGSANAAFPDAALTRDDVVAAWAGIRPLIATDSAAGSASREHTILESPGGVIAIVGGKLTTYRLMAAQVVDRAMRRLARPFVRSTTATTPLPGSSDPPSVADAVRREMAATVGDLLIRRTQLAFRTRDNGRSAAPSAAREMGQLLGWSRADVDRAVTDYDAEAARMFGVDP
jgi:glycerol-3-phosphate dehydrogenase